MTQTFQNPSIPLACGFLAVTLALGTGCDMAEPTATADSSERTLLLLGEQPAADSAVRRISSDFDVLRSADLGLTGKYDIADVLPSIDGVGVNLAGASAEDIATWKPITRAARDAGIPIFIGDVEHSEQVAGLVGLGLDAELLMIVPTDSDSHRIRVYGANELVTEQLGEMGEPIALTPALDDDVDRGVSEIRAQLQSFEVDQVAKSVPVHDYQYYYIDFSTLSLNLAGDQVAELNLDFDARLVRESDHNAKYVFLRPVGAGHHPGDLEWNSSSKRGFYQESIKVTITPSNSNVAIYDHAPSSPNSGSTYTSATGWTIGSSGGYPELSYSQSAQVSTTLQDFETINHTSGDVASWTFQMSTNWNNLFKHPFMEKCKVKGLPSLAKSNLKPEFEVIYRADETYTGYVSFDFDVDSEFRKIWRGGDVFNCKKYWSNGSSITKSGFPPL